MLKECLNQEKKVSSLFGFLDVFLFFLVFLELFGFYCVLKMFPLHVLDQVQLTLLTHEKTASLKTRKKHQKAHYQGPLF